MTTFHNLLQPRTHDHNKQSVTECRNSSGTHHRQCSRSELCNARQQSHIKRPSFIIYTAQTIHSTSAPGETGRNVKNNKQTKNKEQTVCLLNSISSPSRNRTLWMQIVEDGISEWLPALHARRLPGASLFLRAQSHRKHALHHQRVAQQKWEVINKREGV